MKSIVLFGAFTCLFICLSFANKQADVFYGKWKFIATHSDPGDGSGKWIKVPYNLNKYLLFRKNGKLGGNYFGKATYVIIDSTSFSITFANKNTIEYAYMLKNDTLIISQSKPIVCDDGCSSKFAKIR